MPRQPDDIRKIGEERERIEPEEALEVPQEKAVKEFDEEDETDETLGEKIEYVDEETSPELFWFCGK